MSRAFLFASLLSVLPACALAQEGQQGHAAQPAAPIVRMPTGPIGATASGSIVPPSPDGPHEAGAFYPAESRRNFEEGDVIVNFVVKTDGTVSDAVVATSSGVSRLDAAALAAIATFRYHPATQDGTPIAYRLNAMLRFRLDDAAYATTNFTIIEAPADAYPSDAFVKRQQGAATILAVIDTSGRAVHTAIVQSSGVPALDQASLNLVNHRWTFVPASLDGKPLKSFFYLIVNWTLPAVPPKPKGEKPV
ncbi:MAG TPA: energy transducer TonB [Rhizomicrobium sp.]|nr:energy transducer TonB [Rhizomicrobium sp.]HUN92204.1 energy transducer TonB [Burkholderiaceae bacterium]